MDLGLTGRTAIVCASSSGLGRACANSLAREGANIVLNARNEESLASTAGVLARAHPRVVITYVVGDIGDAAVRRQLVASVDRVDILVTNAGGPPVGDFHKLQSHQWHSAVEQNLLSAIDLIGLSIEAMRYHRFGRIINIASSMARQPRLPFALSGVTRAGLVNFCCGLAGELVGSGVTVNSILPGPFATARLDGTRQAQGQTGSAHIDPGDPDDLGDMCAFLCSKQAGTINGEAIVMDGGRQYSVID